MESSKWRRWMPDHFGNIVIVLAFVLIIAMVLLATFRPDRGANLFERAQRLEAAGQWEQALGHYQLLVETEPNSTFAPRALMQQGEILEGMARRSGKLPLFQQAITKYQQLSVEYSGNPLAGQALLNAAEMAANDLTDYPQATRLYDQVLADFPRNMDYGSQATLALGRIALAQQDAERAQKYFGMVLDRFKTYPDRCAEAQYQTGVVAETLTRRPEVAKAAYLLTIKNYPTTVWATNAKARLGMLFYGDIAPGGPARRVMTRLSPLPDTGYADNSPFLPLALALSARGLEVGPATLKAWTLQPFFTGFDRDKPGTVISVQNQFDNAVANAGLRYEANSFEGQDSSKAFAALREAVDRGQTPLVFTGKWALVVGYDIVAQQIFTQRDGAQIETIALNDFLQEWAKAKPRSEVAPRKAYTFLSFQPASGSPKVTAKSTEQEKSPLVSTPSFELTLPALSRKDADKRTIRRAALLLTRAHQDKSLLNIEALGQLASDFAAMSTPPPSPVPVPEDEDSTETVGSTVDWKKRLERAAHLAPWFDAPLKQWIEARRDAANYLENAARTLGDKRLQQASNEFRLSVTALQNAATNFPSTLKSDPPNLWTTALGQQLQRVAQDLREARDAERRAAKLLQEAS